MKSQIVSFSNEDEHEFGALNTLLLVVCLGLCIVTAYLVRWHKVYYLAECSTAILIGMISGYFASILYPSKEELKFLTLNPEIFFFILLPPIIFEAAYSLEKKDFFANIWTILLYAFAGTIISTFIIGYLVYWLGLTGAITIDTSNPMEALLFGSLISAVDPVATLSIMGKPELHCHPLLYSLLFGESVLNDAVAIVLFKIFVGVYDSGSGQFSTLTFLEIFWQLCAFSIGDLA